MAEILGKIIGTSIAKIVTVLLPFLLVLFPNNPSLICIDQTLHNNSNVAVSKIIAAFEEKNVEALEELMCYNIKQNTEDLPDKIKEMYSYVEGDIIEFIKEDFGSSFSANHGDGKQISQSGIAVTIKTTENEYSVGAIWEAVNTFKPEETGIRSITLQEKLANDNKYKKLYQIRATEGVSGWHE